MLKAKYLIWAVFFAFGHWSMTQSIFWGVAEGNVLMASLLNAGYIVVFILLEKIEIYIYKRWKARSAGKKPGLLLQLYGSYMKGASLKSALYLFYFVILVFATIDTASPGYFNDYLSDYLKSVQYGILLLLAADAFITQLSKDIDNDLKEDASEEHV